MTKSKVRLTGKLYNPSKFTTQTGADLYSFSMQISQQDKRTQEWLNVFLPVTIFDKENRHGWIMNADKQEITCEGQLSVKAGFAKRDGTQVAAHVSVFGFDAILRDKLVKTSPQQPIQAPLAPTQTAPASFPDMNDGSSIPF